MTRKKTRKIIKSADDGEIKSKQFAEENPLTTYELTIKEVTVAEAVKVLTDALRNDENFYFAYQSNIAMTFYDVVREKLGESIGNAELHDLVNEGAKRFLNLWLYSPPLDESNFKDLHKTESEPPQIIEVWATGEGERVRRELDKTR